MPEYSYSALLPNGKKTKGTYQAGSENAVLAFLHEHDMTPIEVTPYQPRQKLALRNPFQRGSANLKDIVFFTRQFATMMNAGLNVSTVMATMKKQKTSHGLRKALEDIHDDVNLGVSLSEALRKHKGSFPSFLMRMMEVGELSGNLDSIMLKLADYYEREYEVNKKIKGALIYPAVILVVTVLMLVFILVFVLPNFQAMFESSGATLPLITRILIALSESIQANWYLYLGSVLALVFGLRAFAKTDRGYDLASRAKLKLPLIKGNYQMIVTSRFARTMQILLYSGITITYALEITANVMDNTVLKKKVLAVKEDVNQGEPFSASLEKTGVFPDILLSMVEIGETSGSLDEMLEKSSTHYDKEMENAVNQMIKLIEPMAILLVAVLVGFAVFAILMPMLDMINLF